MPPLPPPGSPCPLPEAYAAFVWVCQAAAIHDTGTLVLEETVTTNHANDNYDTWS